MEQESKITWEIPVESAEQMLSEHATRNEWLAGIRKQLAESKEVMREMIGRMTDEEVMELVDVCFDELSLRDYASLSVYVKNAKKEDLPYMANVCGEAAMIASALMYLCIQRETFAKIIMLVARECEARREEFAELIGDDADAEEVADE